MLKQNNKVEEEFMKSVVNLAKDRNLTSKTLNNLLDELNIGEEEQ